MSELFNCFFVVLQVSEKLEALQAERDKLEEQWNKKQSWLEIVHLEQVFYRDMNNIDKMSSSQEVHPFCVCSPEKRETSQPNQSLITGNISTDPAEKQHPGKHS